MKDSELKKEGWPILARGISALTTIIDQTAVFFNPETYRNVAYRYRGEC